MQLLVAVGVKLKKKRETWVKNHQKKQAKNLWHETA
jgi:hypothetical protein